MGASVFGGCTPKRNTTEEVLYTLRHISCVYFKKYFQSFLEMFGNEWQLFCQPYRQPLSSEKLIGWFVPTCQNWIKMIFKWICIHQICFLLFQYHRPDYFLLLLFWCGVLLLSICCNHMDFNPNTCLCWWTAFGPAQAKDLSHSVFASSKAQT